VGHGADKAITAKAAAAAEAEKAITAKAAAAAEAEKAITAKAAGAALGNAVSALQEIDPFTFLQQFQNGEVCWSPSNGAHEVHGEIRRKYDMLRGPSGGLGLPTTDESGTPDGIGRFNHFDHGSIYWTPRTGPMAVMGSIREKWASLGWERGALGYPVTDGVRWRTVDPSVDQFITWNLFENGGIVSTKNLTAVAPTAHITPEQLKRLVHKAADVAVHQLPNNIGLYPDVQITHVSDWEGDFIASKRRAVTFKLHGFHDNGLLGDTEFYFWFALRFYLSIDAQSFTDPWFRSLQVELIPASVGVDIKGISGWFVSGDDYKHKIEDAFRQHSTIGGAFPVTTSFSNTPGPPHDQVKLVIIDTITTASGGLDFLVSPEPAFPGTDGSFVPLIQQKINDFIDSF
jgi:hypothetical protein